MAMADNDLELHGVSPKEGAHGKRAEWGGQLKNGATETNIRHHDDSEAEGLFSTRWCAGRSVKDGGACNRIYHHFGVCSDTGTSASIQLQNHSC